MARTLEAPAAGVVDDRRDGRKWLVLIAMVFGLFMPMLDNLVVNVALPTIQRQLGAGVSSLQWIIDGYTLTFASFMLTGGALGDLSGRKRFFMGGLIVFTLGSLLCGLSATTGQLIGFRALQGLGAALLLPGSLSIITATFSGKERGAAIGIWAAMSGLAVAIGPVVGGYLVEHVSWESIFFVNIPVGILGLALTYVVVRETRDPSTSRKIDPPGLVTGTSGLFFLVYALIEGNARGWTDGLILGAFGLALVLLISFFWIEATSKSPMLPLSFFRIPTFAASNVVAAAVFFAMFGTVFFLTLYLQNVLGYSPVQAGTRLLAFSAVILVVAPLSGRLSDRFGSRWLMTAGTLVAALGLGLMLRTQPGSPYLTVILPSFIVLAAGMAMTMTPMTAAVMASVHPRHAGVASAATNTSRELGGVFGIALLGAVVTSAFQRGFLARLVESGVPRNQAELVVAKAGARAAAGSAGGGANADLIHAVQRSFVHSIHVGLYVAIGFMLLASLVSFLFVRSHVGEEVEEAMAVGA
jgi:EmrB/QacA subfamily drug resistance transporter